MIVQCQVPTKLSRKIGALKSTITIRHRLINLLAKQSSPGHEQAIDKLMLHNKADWAILDSLLYPRR